MGQVCFTAISSNCACPAVFIALSSVFQIIVLCACCPSVRWLGVQDISKGGGAGVSKQTEAGCSLKQIVVARTTLHRPYFAPLSPNNRPNCTTKNAVRKTAVRRDCHARKAMLARTGGAQGRDGVSSGRYQGVPNNTDVYHGASGHTAVHPRMCVSAECPMSEFIGCRRGGRGI